MIQENIKNSSLIFKMALIDLKKIYRGTIMGWFWIIANPTMRIFMYWFVFAIGLRLNHDVNGYSFFLWLITGILPWLYISEMLAIGPQSYRKYGYLVTKIKFPIITIPNFLSISRLLVNLILTFIITLIYLFYGGSVDIYFIQLPLMIILMYLFMTSLGTLLALLGALSKDFGNLIKMLITPILFLTPVLWRLENITIHWLVLLERLNPVHFIVNGYRNIFIYKEWITKDLVSLVIFIALIGLSLICSNHLYKKLKKELPDYL